MTRFAGLVIIGALLISLLMILFTLAGAIFAKMRRHDDATFWQCLSTGVVLVLGPLVALAILAMAGEVAISILFWFVKEVLG